MEGWFKWLGWVLVTAAISYAWWQTKSHFVIPVVLISLAYVWVSVFRGFGAFLEPLFEKWRWGLESRKAAAWLVSTAFYLYALVTLFALFIGLFNS